MEIEHTIIIILFQLLLETRGAIFSLGKNNAHYKWQAWRMSGQIWRQSDYPLNLNNWLIANFLGPNQNGKIQYTWKWFNKGLALNKNLNRFSIYSLSENIKYTRNVQRTYLFTSSFIYVLCFSQYNFQFLTLSTTICVNMR